MVGNKFSHRVVQVIYQFLEFRIDVNRFAIYRLENVLDPEPKVLELILFLIDRRDRLVTRNDLMEGLWPGRIVTEGNLTNLVKSARNLLADDGKTQRAIKTVHGRGYQFVAEINVSSAPEPDIVQGQRVAPEFDSAANSLPFIAVLPFQNMGSDPDDGYFAEGISEDVITELSRFSDLKVIARHSSFQFDASGINVDEIKRALKIDYLLEGSVRRSAGSLRINVQLIDLSNADHIWAERYDRPLDQIFEVQNEIIGSIASIVCGEVRRVETARAKVRQTEQLSSYEHLLRGLSYHKDGRVSRDNFIRAKKEFNKALDIDRDYPRARAWVLCAEASTWTSIDPEKIREFIAKGQQVLALDPNESEAHRILGSLHFTNNDYDLSQFHFDTALRLNPNDALVSIKYAQFCACIDQCDKALGLAHGAMRLNPRHPPWYWQILGFVYYSKGQFEDAVTAYRQNWNPDVMSYALTSAAYVALDVMKEAAHAVTELKSINSELTASMLTHFDSFRDAEKRNLLHHRMVLAGMDA